MAWPPQVGEPLPDGVEVTGVRTKLVRYSLDVTHEDGGPKARGFESILGITIDDVDHLASAIRIGVLSARVSEVRANPPHGFNCAVDIAVRGVGDKRSRTIDVRTVWEIKDRGQRPRLVSAFPRP